MDTYMPPLTGKPEQQRFTTRSGVLTSTRLKQLAADNCPTTWTFEALVRAGRGNWRPAQNGGF